MSETAQGIDEGLFRETLSHFPTGVVVVTALVDGAPTGMVVGSFTSVSLDPPLVAYLPSKTSSSYARLQSASRFCVNVLAVEQEPLCRRFAARDSDKFAGVAWTESEFGSPRLDEAVAWIDCDVEATLDGGDHDIVLGRVLGLSARGESSPLLFFQGGYGGFRSRSMVAPFATDLRDQLQVADAARDHMERLADELGLECFAQAIVDGDIVIVAGAGGHDGTRAQIGRRLPLAPPYGAALLAGADLDEGVRRWTTHVRASDEQRAIYRHKLQLIRERGWSLALRAEHHDEIWAEVSRSTTPAPTPATERRLAALLTELLPFYEPDALPEGPCHPRLIAVPVRRDGEPVLALALFGLPDEVDPERLRHLATRLQAAAAAIETDLAAEHSGA